MAAQTIVMNRAAAVLPRRTEPSSDYAPLATTTRVLDVRRVPLQLSLFGRAGVGAARGPRTG